MRPPLQAMVVVIPARDERLLLGACLDAVASAAERVDLPVLTVVALDRCTDGTEQVLLGRQVTAVATQAGCVGAARAAGVRAGLDQLGGTGPDRVWIANTDADSRVDPGWLAHQLALADSGADLVLGTVWVADTSTSLASAWAAGYSSTDGHRHVHGANLGVLASAYLRAGGFRALPVHEDVELAAAVAAQPGAVVVRTGAAPVTTSGRLMARAPGGFAAHLRGLQVG